jgi:hypothetical protein
LNKCISLLIDSIAISKKNALRSKISQFNVSSNAPIKLKDIDEFYMEPVIPEIEFNNIKNIDNYQTGEFSFASQIKNNGENNNTGRGVFYQSNSDNKVNVVVVHGWKSSNLDRVRNMFVERFVQRGYNTYFIKLPHHFDRMLPESSYSGEYMISANIDRTLLSIRQSVADTRDLIAWLGKSRGKTILIGVSLGGLITNLVSCRDRSFDGLVSIMYANNLAYVIWNSAVGKYIKKDFKKNGFSYNELERYWAITVASNYKPVISKDRILLISGLYDRFVPIKDSYALNEKWGHPKQLLYRCGHSGQQYCKDNIGEDVCSFIEEIMTGES